MKTSESIKTIAPLLLEAQKNMADVKKGAKNPFFKSNYADLNSIREAAIPVLNELGITILQPTIEINGKNYVETMLLHTSGEFVSAQTAIINQKGTAQDEGSGQSYARRYGLQSMLNIGAVDDDGEATMNRKAQSSAIKETVQTALHTSQSVGTGSNTGLKGLDVGSAGTYTEVTPVVKSSFKKSTTSASKTDTWD